MSHYQPAFARKPELSEAAEQGHTVGPTRNGDEDGHAAPLVGRPVGGQFRQKGRGNRHRGRNLAEIG
jgi:hypothetical protein